MRCDPDEHDSEAAMVSTPHLASCIVAGLDGNENYFVEVKEHSGLSGSVTLSIVQR